MAMNSYEDDLPTFVRILGSLSPLFENDEDIAACEKLMAGLSQDELECLAKSSYAYWLVSKLSPNKLPDGAQKHAVMKEIRRHYIGEGRDETKAIHVIKEAIDLRKQWNVDLMRLCFYPDLKKRWGVTEDETAIVTRLEELIGGEQSRQQMIVRGSAEGHPIAFKAHRLTPTTADENESYVIAQMYIAERAFAVAEFNTEAKVEKVLAIFYFKDYISGHSVTVSASKQSSTAMQRIYPERLKTLFICDPPFFLRIIITIVLAILSSATREKINLVIGTDALTSKFAELTGDAGSKVVQMLKDGDYSSSADNEHFLSVVPFYRYYDDVATK